jgi:hypothetical protein
MRQRRRTHGARGCGPRSRKAGPKRGLVYGAAAAVTLGAGHPGITGNASTARRRRMVVRGLRTLGWAAALHV